MGGKSDDARAGRILVCLIRRFVAVGVAALGIATVGVAGMRLSVTHAPDEETQIEQRYQRDELPPTEAIGVTFRCTSGSGERSFDVTLSFLRGRRSCLVGRRRRINLGRQPPFRSPTRCMS